MTQSIIKIPKNVYYNLNVLQRSTGTHRFWNEMRDYSISIRDGINTYNNNRNHGWGLVDKDGFWPCYIDMTYTEQKTVRTRLITLNLKENGTQVSNNLSLSVGRDGSVEVGIDQPKAWLTALKPNYIMDASANSYAIGMSYDMTSLTTTNHFAVWTSESITNSQDGQECYRVVSTMTPTNAHKVLSAARPMFKYKTKTYTNITLNKGSGGYAALNDYGGIPSAPNGYTLFEVGISTWGSVSTKQAISVTYNGLYIMGPNAATIDTITLRFIYVLTDNYVNAN